jgi:4-hydroxythreonine-4-phosphate dehydrogenase
VSDTEHNTERTWALRAAAPESANRSGKRQLPIAVTLGDPAGIGPDITLESWRLREARALHPFAVYGDVDAVRDRARALGLDVPVAAIADIGEAVALFPRALPVVRPARPTLPGGRAPDADARIVGAIEEATAAVLAGAALALVTNPIAKRSLRSVPLPYPGHTAFLGQLAQRHTGRAVRPVMMLAAPELRVVPATVHIPLSAVPATLTRALMVETGRITAHALAQDFAIADPRIAVAGLNPHAGEDGLIGSEEAETIVPAIAELRAEGVAVSGPYSADSMFHAEARRGYDAAIAMYHDQALIPVKTLAFDTGVNVTLGLPFVRTSPDHGTAYALAGTGKARPDSLLAALALATQMGERRLAARSSAQSPAQSPAVSPDRSS